MTKLATIRKLLKQCTSISIVAINDDNDLFNPIGAYHHLIEFVIAPKKPTYPCEELQKILVQFSTPLEATLKEDFHEDDHFFHFGKLHFDECIGVEMETRKIIVSDEELFSLDGFGKGTCTTSTKKDLLRRVTISVYPDRILAQHSLYGGGRNTYFIHQVLYERHIKKMQTPKNPVPDRKKRRYTRFLL